MSDDVELISYRYNRAKDFLGKGSWAQVYTGHSKTNKSQLFAIKEIQKDKIDFTEIQILKELSGVQHRNLARLVDHEETQEVVYLVMEYCNGGDLAKYLEEKKTMDEASIKIFLQQIAAAMKVLFEHNIIHRDLKPANILLNHNGVKEIDGITFKIADFGVGRYLDKDFLAQTFCGTPLYMAPEVLLRTKYDYKADLWSIGAVVYKCLTGQTLSSTTGPFVYPKDIDASLKDLLERLLCVKTSDRISFNEFYRHPFIGLKFPQPHGRTSITDPVALDYKQPESPKLASIKEGESVSKHLPPVVPPKPFKDPKVIHRADKHAAKVSATKYKSLQDIVDALINSSEITDEMGKARVIFSWLCSKDLKNPIFDKILKDVNNENPQRHGGATYASVYKILCDYARLQCEVIVGYSKLNDYKIAIKFVGNDDKHPWNAVCVDGFWRFVDCRAARMVDCNDKCDAEDSYELDDFYFMPDPKELIFIHFADDRTWQLIEKPITLVDFETYVPVTSTFFKYGLELVNHKEAVVYAKPKEQIHIGFPSHKRESLSFTFILTYDNGKDEYKGVNLERFVMQEVTDSETIFTIRLPQKSSYRLAIFARDRSTPATENEDFKVCEYKLYCEASPAEPLPFPPLVHAIWGSRNCADKYGLVPLAKGAVVNTVNGVAEVRFQAQKKLEFSARLKKSTSKGKGEDLDEDLVKYGRTADGVVIFAVTAPSNGEFGLEVFVNDPSVDGNALYHACQYLIVCDEDLGP